MNYEYGTVSQVARNIAHPLGRVSKAVSQQRRGRTEYAERASTGIPRRDASNALFSSCVPFLDKIGLEIRPRGCVILRVMRYVRAVSSTTSA